jgi:hypothetical protein
MTIGIAAWGPNAALATLLALQAAERVGTGAIGGFVSWVALGGDACDQVWRSETQRHGTSGLFDAKGIGAMPTAWSKARCAGLMSSGPDRPEPLAQFTPALAKVGLVTGHRLPNNPTGNGIPMNVQVLQSMAQGQAPSEALELSLRQWPETDGGIIALNPEGDFAIGNTDAVKRRKDLGSATLGSREQGALVAVIHNSITPNKSLAALVCEVAWNAMHAKPMVQWIMLPAGVPVFSGSTPAVWVDATGRVTKVQAITAHSSTLTGIGLGDQVAIHGSDGTHIGWLGYEPYIVVERGQVVSADGQPHLNIPVSPQ